DISQEEVPDQVKETFNEEYASAKDTKWKQGEEKGTYEAEFSERGEEMEAVYDEYGEKKMVMTEIKRDELPQAIRQTLGRDYTDYNLENFYRVEKEGKTKYKVKAEK